MDRSSAPADLDAELAALSAGLELIALRRLGNREDAIDASQETIARLLERVSRGRVANASELAPIAYGIARHVIADMLRGRSRETEPAEDVASTALGPLDALVLEDERAFVHDAMAQLSHEDRALLHRCFVDGERIGCIAASRGEPAERLRKRKSRALERLAAALSRRHVGFLGGAKTASSTAAAAGQPGGDPGEESKRPPGKGS